MKRLVMSMLIGCAALQADCRAAILFVDQKNPAAKDENDGSDSKPFKTITGATRRVAPGDTVTIRSGIYREEVDLKASGSADHPIVVTAAQGDRVEINGADVVKDWVPVAKDPKKRPLWVKSGWHPGSQVSADPKTRGRGPQVSVDDVIYHETETVDDLFPGTFFADVANGTIVLWPLPPRASATSAADTTQFWDAPVNLASNNPNDHLVEVAARPISFLAGAASYTTIKGILIRHGDNAAQEGAMQVVGNHNVIEDCTVEYTHGRGLSVTGQFDTVHGCTLCFNGSCGAGAQLSDSVFSANNLYRNSTLGVGDGWENGGVKFSRSVNLKVSENRFISNEGPGLWFDFCNSNIVIERNLSVDNVGANIMMEITPNYKKDSLDAKPQLNTNRNETLAIPWRDDATNIVRNNICVGARGPGSSGILLQLASRTHVLNNTIVNNGSFGIFVRYHPYNTEGNRCWDNVIMNNVLVNNGAFQVYITPDPVDKPGYVARNTSDNNLLFQASTATGFGSDSARYTRWGKTEFAGNYSQEELSKIFGYDAHSIQGDPLFVMPEVLDFRLQRGSPAVGLSIRTEEVTDDFAGNPRPKEHPSLGAMEISSIPESPEPIVGATSHHGAR